MGNSIVVSTNGLQAVDEGNERLRGNRSKRTPLNAEQIIQKKIAQRSNSFSDQILSSRILSGPQTPKAQTPKQHKHEIPCMPKREHSARNVIPSKKSVEDNYPGLFPEASESKNKIESNFGSSEISVCENNLQATPVLTRKQNHATRNHRVRALVNKARSPQKPLLAKIEKHSNSEHALVNFLRQMQATTKETTVAPSKTSFYAPLPAKKLNLSNVTPVLGKEFNNASNGSRKVIVSGATGVFGKIICGVYSSCAQESMPNEPRRIIYYQVVNSEQAASTEIEGKNDGDASNDTADVERINNLTKIVGGDARRVVLRHESNGRWIIGHPALRSQRTVLLAYCAESKLSDPMLAKRWYVANSTGNFLVQPCLKVTIMDRTNEEVKLSTS